MDARALLEATAAAYRGLESLSCEMRVTSEPEDRSSLNQSKVKAWYRAPDLYRFETAGRRGETSVTRGLEASYYWAGMKRFHRFQLSNPDHIRGLFNPDSPAATAYLFPRILENVARIEFLRQEQVECNGLARECAVVEASYAPSPHAHWAGTGPALIWLDLESRLVLRLECEIWHRRPAEDEVEVTKQTLEFVHQAVNEPIDPTLFTLDPPEGATESGPDGFVTGSGGSGWGEVRPDGSKVEARTSRTWEGQILIESSKMKLHGFDLQSERRYTLSDDKRELRIDDTLAGPSGESRAVHVIRLI